jgi:YHS domain-containing protein
MTRAIIELCITILIAYVARAVIASLMRGISNASSQAFQQSRPAQPNSDSPPPSPSSGSQLHKDPVCGTYVSESTPYRRQRNGTTVYYCSTACREKHAA